MFKYIPFCFLFLLSQISTGQVFQTTAVPFYKPGGTELLTLAGGLNSPQFSKADLNEDGVEDLYIFDRSANVHLPFLISEQNGEVTYTYDYSYALNFPKCKFWVALRDYNGDGIKDLFTYEAESQVYKGKYENGRLAFDRVELNQGAYMNFLTYYDSLNSIDFISLFPDDYPVIEDVDGDGDLDILAFSGNPSVNFYQNQAVEYGYPLDSLVYTLADECWGRFARNVDNEVILSSDINECAHGFTSGDNEDRMHLTLTLMVYDEDGDGDMDAMVGSATSTTVTKLVNNSSSGTDFMTEAYSGYPDYDVQVDIQAYPTVFYLDVDNDGTSELLAAPNQIENGEDVEAAWLYRNNGPVGQTAWELQQTDWLTDEMVELGSNSAPAFLDYNADGLMDMVVGSGGIWLWTNRGSLVLFENTGTTTEPAFTLVDEDWQGLAASNDSYSNFTPATGDLDGDGDIDLLLGCDSGELIFLENEAGAGNPVVFADPVFGWKNILVGRKTTPQIADINRDGLMDLLIGERNGNINFMPNLGAIGDPQFEPIHELPPNNEFFGEISTAGTAVLGNATPYILDRGTHFLLIVGAGTAGLSYYEFTSDEIDDVIPPSSTDWGKLRKGDNLYPAMADLNDDGFLELVLGGRRGGLTLFDSPLGVTSTFEKQAGVQLEVFPNPVNDKLMISIDGDYPNGYEFRIYNGLGQLVKTGGSPDMNVGTLPAGVYWLNAQKKESTLMRKFVVQH